MEAIETRDGSSIEIMNMMTSLTSSRHKLVEAMKSRRDSIHFLSFDGVAATVLKPRSDEHVQNSKRDRSHWLPTTKIRRKLHQRLIHG
jgi:hypothetical protein